MFRRPNEGERYVRAAYPHFYYFLTSQSPEVQCTLYKRQIHYNYTHTYTYTQIYRFILQFSVGITLKNDWTLLFAALTYFLITVDSGYMAVNGAIGEAFCHIQRSPSLSLTGTQLTEGGRSQVAW